MTKRILPPPRRQIERAAPYLLALYSLLLFLLHFVRIFDNSFWGDEGFTIRLAKMNFVDMVIATAKDVHPPLYYFFTQILCHIFGFHGFTYHLSAVLPYGLILVLCCTVIRKWFGLIPAAVVVTLSSLTDAAIIYNVEARMYSLAALFVLVAYLAFYQIYQKNRPVDWFLFGFASLCAAYTHYYALISVAFFYLMLLPLLGRSKDYFKRIAVTYLAAVVIYLPWLFVLLRSFKTTSDNWWLTAPPSAKETLVFLFGHSWLFFIFVAVVAVFFLYQLKVLSSQKNPDTGSLYRFELSAHGELSGLLSNESIWILAGLFSFLGTIGVGWVLTKAIRPFFLTRYIYQLSAVLYLILGFCLSKLQLRRSLASVLLLLVLLSNFPLYSSTYRSERELDRSTTAFLEAVQPPEDAFLYTSNYYLDWTLFENYYPGRAHALDENYDLTAALNSGEADIWVFWQHEFSESDMQKIADAGYSAASIYDGVLADHTYYHVYRLQKSEVEVRS